MTNTQATTEPGIQFRTGNAKLCHELRNLAKLARFKDQVREIAEQLSYLDQFPNHDELLSGDEIAKAQGGRTDLTVLSLARGELAQALRHLKNAHQHVAGSFKGEMRDETEEDLARAIKGFEARLERIDQVRAQYKEPRRPHEIRRNALSYLLARCSEVCEEFQQLVQRIDSDVPASLVSELRLCEEELFEFKAGLTKLRERCSQKMEQNLLDCAEKIEAIAEHIATVELEAGRLSGSWFPDYAARL